MKDINRIFLVKDDITKLVVDAIVNAANSRLAGGGGVDEAIHRAAGPELSIACKQLGGCKTGSSKITDGYNLPSKHIIHTVGPIYRGGNSGENELLRSCYQTCLELAIKNNIRTIAFPNISTGIYGYPKQEAANIAIETVQNFIADNSSIEKVTFVCFDNDNYEIYRKLMAG